LLKQPDKHELASLMEMTGILTRAHQKADLF